MDFARSRHARIVSTLFPSFFMLPFSVKLLRRWCAVSSLFVTVVWKVRLVHLIFAVPQIQEQIVQATARVDVHISAEQIVAVPQIQEQNVEVVEVIKVILEEQCQQLRFFF